MLKVYLMLVWLAAAVFAESVRETETWVPLKNKSLHGDLESSGDSLNGGFEFTDSSPTTDDEDRFEEDEDDDDDDNNMSGSGEAELISDVDLQGIINNWIPDSKIPVPPRPTMDDTILVKSNEVLRRAPNQDYSETNEVLMSHAGDESLFSNKEVLAAVIAGGVIGLIFAIVLIFLLVHFVLRIKKKDEGSYDLGKTPIYRKAPTSEIYA